jgi:hypothetical protein
LVSNLKSYDTIQGKSEISPKMTMIDGKTAKVALKSLG